MSIFTNQESIVLIGISGSGKSTIGRELARATKKEFIDTDKEIEKRYDLSIEDLFKKGQAEKFRTLEERYLIEKLTDTQNSVIAVGAGGLSSVKVQEVLIGFKFTVFLDLETSIALERVKGKRPLLILSNVDAWVKTQEERKEVYCKIAKIKICLGNEEIAEAVAKIKKALATY